MKLRVFSRCGIAIFCVLAVFIMAKGARSSEKERQGPDVQGVVLSVAGSLGYTVASIDGEKKTVLITSNGDGISKTIKIVFLEDGKTMDISARATGDSYTVCQDLAVRIVEEFIQGLSDQLRAPKIK